MYVVTRIYIQENRSINTWDKSEITPPEVYKKMDSEDTVVYLAIKDTNKTSENMFGINFSEVLTDTDIGKLETWNEINAKLTQAIILGYMCRIPGYVTGDNQPKRALTTWNLMNTFKTFNIGYGDHLSQRHDIPAIKWALTDLRISFMDTATVKPTLANCLPIINGMACRPYYDSRNNVLYGLNGAKYAWNEYLPEVSLIDFSRLGEIEIERIARDSLQQAPNLENTTTIIHRGGNDPLVLHRSWNWYTNKNLSEYTPIVVLGGSVIWPDEITIDNEHQFRFFFFNKNLNRTRAWGEFCQSNSLDDTALVYQASPIIEYFENEFAKPADNPSASCFVLYIKNSNLVINRRKLYTWRGGISLDLYAPEGVLVRDYTHTVHSYHSERLVDRQVLTVQHSENLYLDSVDLTGTENIYAQYDCKHIDLQRISDSSYTMLYVMS